MQRIAASYLEEGGRDYVETISSFDQRGFLQGNLDSQLRLWEGRCTARRTGLKSDRASEAATVRL